MQQRQLGTELGRGSEVARDCDAGSIRFDRRLRVLAEHLRVRENAFEDTPRSGSSWSESEESDEEYEIDVPAAYRVMTRSYEEWEAIGLSCADEPQDVQYEYVAGNGSGSMQGNQSISVIDNRTGRQIEIPIEHATISAVSFSTLGLRLFDPGFMNTAVAKSRISYIDGDNGILQYRGYNIEELAEKSTFLEVSFLLIKGELPTPRQLQEWSSKIMGHTYVHENMNELLKTFRYDAHPMGIVISALSALGTFYPQFNPALSGSSLYLQNERARNKQIYRILGKLPTIAASAYRHRIGRPYNSPKSSLSYTENFLYMMDKLSEVDYEPDPRLARALDILFILHAEHEMNCSTAAMRHLSSSQVDPFTAVAGAAGALYGPLHGGANEAVLRMLEEIGSVENIPQFIEDVKTRKKLLMGFGHRIYKNYDPRARIVKRVADEVFEILGKEPLIEVAMELERLALSDPYFIDRKLYPNVDFYSGLIYKAIGFPTDMFPVLFTLPRAAGWLAHWVESLDDPDTRIYRPRQVYLGAGERAYVSIEERKESDVAEMDCYVSTMSKRRSRG